MENTKTTKQTKPKSGKKLKVFLNGLIHENPIFVLFLGMCPVLATTSSFSSAFGMGLAVIVVLVLTNLIISLIRRWVPDEIRIPVFIIIIAAVVSIVEMLMYAYTFTLAETLGVYLSIIVVNCIILGRAEAFASKVENSPLDSIVDALGNGLGFFLVVVILSVFREIIGTGGLAFANPFSGATLFDVQLFPQKYAISLFTQNAGAFIMLGFLVAAFVAIQSAIKANKEKKAKQAKEEGGKA
ncbi:MAG: electron transport complex subunit RsxE [Erysipelotrichaceae bacterium]|nr:electron transport complex subunit RsxE [Erysipelotrichaceae bacterium]